MKNKKLKIKISRPVDEVFLFTTDPKNTPTWVDSILVEETNEWPIRVGTVYRNKARNGDWSEYIVTEIEKNKMFVFSRKNSDYKVKYLFTSLGDHETELEYFEWVEVGELEEPFEQKNLNKLKEVLEKT